VAPRPRKKSAAGLAAATALQAQENQRFTPPP